MRKSTWQMRFAFLCMIVGIADRGFSQGVMNGYPFEAPADPRSFAMGESFTGVPSSPSALIYNPAGLAGLTGVCVSYSQRKFEGGYNRTLRAFGVTAGTSFGVFALDYNRDSYGVWPVTLYEGAPPPMNTYDYDVAFGYALGLGRGFSIGAAVKSYDFEGFVPDGIRAGLSTLSAKPATLFDFGFLWTLPRFHSQAVVRDSLSIGMSYQNIGKSYVAFHVDLNPRGLPEYFRMGASYALRVMPRNEGGVSPFQAVFSGEYRTASSSAGFDAYGLGAEITIEEVFSLRVGGSFLGAEETPIRYGVAVRLPVPSLGFDLSFQGAVIPWHSTSALSIEFRTTGNLF